MHDLLQKMLAGPNNPPLKVVEGEDKIRLYYIDYHSVIPQ